MPIQQRLPFFRLATLALLLASLVLSGCSLFQRAPTSEQGLYDRASQQLENRNWSMAIETLNRLESRYPFGRYGQQLQLDRMYARYMSQNYAQALLDADRFTRLNPDHPNVDYAWYLKGMSYYRLYRQNAGLTGRGDLALRSQQDGRRAFGALTDYIERFPDGEYHEEAIDTLVILKDSLARHELVIADYYMRRDAWIAAAERAQIVRIHFPGVTAQADALVVLVESYDKLGLEEERALALAQLKNDYPEHPTLSTGNYRSPYLQQDRWWLKLITLGWFS